MLPELPRTFVLNGVDVVVGYPIGVGVELRGAEVTLLELVVGIDDGLDAVVPFYNVEPLLHALLEVGIALPLGLVLYVEHGGQVALLELDVADEEARLVGSLRMDAVEVVGSARETVLTGLMEVVGKPLVDTRGSLGGLDHDEADGPMVYHAVVLQLLPVDFALMMADVDAVYLVALGIVHVAIERSPAKAEGANEDVIEKEDVDGHNASTAHPPRPTGQALEQTDKKTGTMVNPLYSFSLNFDL